MKKQFNFDTNELNEFMTPMTREERDYILPTLVKLLESEKYPLTSAQICKKIDDIRVEKGMLWKSKMNGARLRKMINFIRSQMTLGIVGDDKGYLATDDLDLLDEQIARQKQRIESQMMQLQGTINYRSMVAGKIGRDDLGFDWTEVEEPVKTQNELDREEFYEWIKK